MSKDELINICEILGNEKNSKDENSILKVEMIKSLYPSFYTIIDELNILDAIYKRIAKEVSISYGDENFRQFGFLWHEYIIDKKINKDFYDKKISGRDFNIFITYIPFILNPCNAEYTIEKTYMETYNIENEEDLPYGILTASKYLKENLGELENGN